MLTHIALIAFNVIYFGLLIGTVIVIILDNRNPVKAIAWLLVLMLLPIVGLILYSLFGRKQRHQHFINKQGLNRLRKRPMTDYAKQDKALLPEKYERLISLFQNTNQAYPLAGNSVELYTTGKDFIHSLIQQMKQARHHIHLESYIIEDDSVGRLVRDVLIEKAREGVEVRVIYDDVGCWNVPTRFFDEMQEESIEVHSFLKVRFPRLTSKVNYRNHRKIVVIDGKTGFIGGMNIADRYVKGVPWGVWRDTHLMVKGTAVHELQTVFLLDWYFVNGSLITSQDYFEHIEPSGSSLMQIVTSNPVTQWQNIMQGLIKAISSARKYFYMQTPYFLPTESMLSALETAALSGVDVRLILPQKADVWLTHLGSCSYLKDVLRAGVKVYLYKKGFLHSKMMVSDNELVTIGSTNLDFRSFEHNFEANAFIYDTQTALQVRELFLEDQRESEQVVLKEWLKRPWYRRFTENIVKLMAPLL